VEVPGEVRNTREVVPIRLSGKERERISKAAKARDLALSSFVRWAALERAADELRRAKPKPRPKPAERGPLILGPEPPALVEEPFRPHSFVDGECSGCGLDLNDHRGRGHSCEPRSERDYSPSSRETLSLSPRPRFSRNVLK
jgi:hypothetical protein